MFYRIIISMVAAAAMCLAQNLPENYELTASGKFRIISTHNITSPDGKYASDFNVASAGDEIRELTDFIFYNNDLPQYKLEKVPGADLYISNAGITAFLDHNYHFNQELTINFYSPAGTQLSSLKFNGANLFGFSPDGTIMGINTPEKITLYNIPENQITEYPRCMSFAINPNNTSIVLADEKQLSVYSGTKLLYTIDINEYVRDIEFIDDNSFAYITRNSFVVHSLKDNKETCRAKAENGGTFNDLLITDNKLFAGIGKQDNNQLTGYIAEFINNTLSAPVKAAVKNFDRPKKNNKKLKGSVYDPIPWPFFPYDSARTAWNHYEQCMGSGISYLHQGLDLIVPISEPVYNVQQGYVKCVLTLGGSSYWRAAISPVQDSGRSDGWLYAHLIENTIAVFPGDTVEIHQYLGDIVEWSSDWGHIHFVNINDSGYIWLYTDNEWGINFNPYLALENVNDTTPPVFLNSSPQSKFEFCKNETSVYLDPDSLYGEIDIIVKIADYIGDSEWQQPAYESFYWIKDVTADTLILPRKKGHTLNHKYPMYDAMHYQEYASVLYKSDASHSGSSWMDPIRSYFHILTNDDGDEVLDSTERYLALDTRLFYDGLYRLYAEVYDPSGNSAVDSIDIKFRNGIVSVNENNIPYSFELNQNYPNPFNGSTVIDFTIPTNSNVSLKLYDVLGKEAAVIVDENMTAGHHRINFSSSNARLSSGVYLYKLTVGGSSAVKKLVLMK